MELKKQFSIDNNFIGIFDNFFKDDFINKCVNYFDFCQKLNMYHERKDKERRNDKHIIIDHEYEEIKNSGIEAKSEFLGEFTNVFYEEIYKIYLEKFPYLKYSTNRILNLKIQKTLPTEGYHVWHYEQDGMLFGNRQTTFILYLNDVNNGGETEFLYQSCRISPKKNRFILWPAAYTHVHRGNPPLNESKYIATGWTVLVE